MGLIYLETERFMIRQWEIDDVEEMYQLMSNPKVHQYTGDKPWTLERTKGYIHYMLEHDFKTFEQFHGACVLKSTNAIVGLTGLNEYLPKQPEIEWQFGESYWGKGYATEIGKALITAAFASSDIESIYGMANPSNTGSMRVLEKLGMTCLGLQVFREEQDVFYKVNRNELHK